MRFHPLSVLSVTFVFTIVPLSGLATPFASRWDDVQAKHAWNSVPENWVNLGHPAADTTIDLHIALKAQNENALIDALYEVSSPNHSKCVLSPTLFRARSTHVCRCPVADTAHTCRRSRSLSLSRRPQTCSISSTPGLSTTACSPPPSPRNTAAVC